MTLVGFSVESDRGRECGESGEVDQDSLPTPLGNREERELSDAGEVDWAADDEVVLGAAETTSPTPSFAAAGGCLH
jgi:hypothetical protein